MPETDVQTAAAPAEAAPVDATQTTNTAPATTNGNGATIADSDDAKGTNGAESAVTETWPQNWRDIMAGGNEKALKSLKHFDSPANVFKSWSAMRSKMDAGEIVRSKPTGEPDDPAYAQALKEWRAQAGVPETPEGYLEKVPDGIVFGEADKPILESFLKASHEADATPSEVHRALTWYKNLEQQQIEERAQRDAAHRAKSEDDLRAEWGPEYRANLANIRSLVNTYGSEGTLEKFFAARTADGTPLGDDPDVLRLLSGLARQINPFGAIPSADSAAGRSMATRKAEIMKAMADQSSEYWRGPKDANGETAMRREYREIIETEQKRGAQAR